MLIGRLLRCKIDRLQQLISRRLYLIIKMFSQPCYLTIYITCLYKFAVISNARRKPLNQTTVLFSIPFGLFQQIYTTNDAIKITTKRFNNINSGDTGDV